MNSLIILNSELKAGSEACIIGDRAKYVSEYHQLKSGDTVKVGVFGGRQGFAEVVESSADGVTLKLELNQNPPPRRAITVIVAVPRPQTVKKVIQAATTLGVDALHFVRTTQVVPSYLQSKSLKFPFVELEIIKALEQACDSIAPKIAIHDEWESFLDHELSTILSYTKGAVLAHTGATRGLDAISSVAKGHVTLAIGPESGWSEGEAAALENRGFEAVTFGPRTLRVETAVTVGISQIALLQDSVLSLQTKSS